MKNIFFVAVSVLFVLFISQIVFAIDIIPFISPDNSYSVLENFLQSSKNDIQIATYTFTSTDIANELLKLKVNITIILEKSPVGGLEADDVLCALQAQGIGIYLYDGPQRYHHAKYIVSGEEVLIATENFGYYSYPPDNDYGNRGWGVIVKDKDTAKAFVLTFEKDLKVSKEFECKLNEYKIDNTDKKEKKENIENYTAESALAFFAPDNALQMLLEIISNATSSIYVQQFYIYKYWGKKTETKPNPLLETLINKARTGVEVKILLDSSTYNVDEEDPISNTNTLEYVNEIARNENLTLEARLIDLKKLNLKKMHVKGLIVDNRTVIVSSINWNENSVMKNREAGIALTEDVAIYFAKYFLKDWYNIRNDIGNDIFDLFPLTGKTILEISPWWIVASILAVLILLVYFLT